MLSPVFDKEGRILVDGIYDQIQEPNERELALIDNMPTKGPEDVAETYGLTLPILKEDRKEFLRRFYFEPALNIEGFGSGLPRSRCQDHSSSRGTC